MTISVDDSRIVFGRRATDGIEFAGDARDLASSAQLRDFLGMLRRRMKWIVATTAITLAAGTVVASLLPARYTAATSILLDPRGLQVVNNDISGRAGSGDGQAAEAESQRYVVV